MIGVGLIATRSSKSWFLLLKEPWEKVFALKCVNPGKVPYAGKFRVHGIATRFFKRRNHTLRANGVDCGILVSVPHPNRDVSNFRSLAIVRSATDGDCRCNKLGATHHNVPSAKPSHGQANHVNPGFVDLIVFFDNDTPLNEIKAVLPDVLAKGADYDPTERDPNSKKYIVGSDVVLKNGGEVIAIPLVQGFSTTSILAKAKG